MKEYTLSINTEKEILRAERIQRKLYNLYNSVKIYTIGLNKIKIVATDKI